MKTLTCEEVERLSTEAAAGSFPENKLPMFEAHLARHPDCARKHQEYLSLSRLLRKGVQGKEVLGQEIQGKEVGGKDVLGKGNPEFEPRVHDLLDRVYGLGRHQRKVWLGAGLRWGMGLATAGLVLALGLGILRPEFSDEELAAWAMDEAGFSLVGDHEDMWEDYFGDL